MSVPNPAAPATGELAHHVVLEFELGTLRFKATGPSEWVEARLKEALDRATTFVPPATPPTPHSANEPKPHGAAKPHNHPNNQHPEADAFLATHGITPGMLAKVLHRSGASYKIINIGGPAKKAAKTLNVYLLSGVAALLETGKATFSDTEARAQCARFACYNQPNHATILKRYSVNLVKEGDNYSLTSPGETAAAELIKSLGSTESK